MRKSRERGQRVKGLPVARGYVLPMFCHVEDNGKITTGVYSCMFFARYLFIFACSLVFLPVGSGVYLYECSAALPPSGTYLDQVAGQWLDYDCSTQTLAPAGPAVTSCITSVVGPNISPTAGVCIVLSSPAQGASSVYDAAILVAVVGSHAVDWVTHAHPDLSAEACGTPGYCAGTYLNNGVVTFYQAELQYNDDLCVPHESAGHITLEDGSGTRRSYSHTNSVHWCIA